MKYRIKNAAIQLCLKVIVYLSRDSRYVKYCKNEVPEWFEEDDGPNLWMAKGTVELLSVLSHQGHSGGSIRFALEFFKTMALFKPWGPLTGDDDEWVEISDDLWQNKRFGSVFKREDGTAYRIDGKVFHDGDECYYTNYDSRVNIEFPYTVEDAIVIDKSKLVEL